MLASEKFWAMQAENLLWQKKWDQVLWYDPTRIGQQVGPYVKWFDGGQLNVSANCLDRHVAAGHGDKTAIIWHSDDGAERKTLTYQELLTAVCRLANVLKKQGIQKGDVVTIFLPMIPEAAIAMLACARIGAIHSVVFSAFSEQSLAQRVNDGRAKVIITADIARHAGKEIALKSNVDAALKGCPTVQHVIVVSRSAAPVPMRAGRDIWWDKALQDPDIADTYPPSVQESEDPLFMLYTSGTTGKPKGVLHTTAGYLLYAHTTLKYAFDIQPDDIYYCTADVGWITGHSYGIYGPLSLGLTTIMFEGVPTYPEPDRFWQIIEQEKGTVFYTAPTAIRALQRLGDAWPEKHDLSSLRVLGTVGEPIGESAWRWYEQAIGGGRCPVIDTWWQTETGGMMITPLAGQTPLKPGSATKPFFGVTPEVRQPDGTVADVNEAGALVITQPWPGMLRGVYGDPRHELIKKTYFSRFPGVYFTGDGARVDADGDFWLLGRIDDPTTVPPHRFTSAEIESALPSPPAVAEAAVIGIPDDLTGQALAAYVTLKQSHTPTATLEQELYQHVLETIGPIAKIKEFHFTDALPKTRSGKIMRRILRATATNLPEQVGDTSTLADPSVIDVLIKK